MVRRPSNDLRSYSVSYGIDQRGFAGEVGSGRMNIVAKSSGQKGERWQADNDMQKVEHDSRFNGS